METSDVTMIQLASFCNQTSVNPAGTSPAAAAEGGGKVNADKEGLGPSFQSEQTPCDSECLLVLRFISVKSGHWT